MKTIGVIPSRYASKRFPGKPLVEIEGKTMIQRVYEQACRAKLLSEVIIATDDRRIYDHARAFGAQVMITSTNHYTGTDRCAEVATRYQDMEAILNIQGDEPFIDPQQIDLLSSYLRNEEEVDIATLAKEITEPEPIFDPNTVKVVFNKAGRALYFSRSPIPYLNGVEKKEWLLKGRFYKHIGIYGFRRQTLLEITRFSRSRLEKMESLEQLRWLDNGYEIGIQLTDQETIGIDTPEDLKKLTDH